MDKVTLTRDQLYDLVWSKPITALASEFGISYNDLKKICKNHNIPLPYMGYWAKLRHGKLARKVKLPASFEGKDEIAFEPTLDRPEVQQKEASDKAVLIGEIETKFQQFLHVPERLTNPDILIVNVKNALADKNVWSNHGLIAASSGFVNITCAPENVSRALRFMDTLTKLLKARGHDINNVKDSSHVIVFGEPLIIQLQEKLRYEYTIEGKYNWKTRHEYPTGIFMLRCWRTFYWHQKVWMDGKVLIENQLAKIVAGIESLAIKERDERLLDEERWKVEKEKQRIEKERHDREVLDAANFQKLLAQSQVWKQSQILNDFIAEIEKKLIASMELTDVKKEWLRWAKLKAENFNPLNNLLI